MNFEDEEQADLTSQHIEGITRVSGQAFRIPLYSQITDNLWSGGCPTIDAPAIFRFIVCLYPWEPYVVHDHQVYTAVKLFDSSEVPDKSLIDFLARHVIECARIGPTLVHCQAGINRSALIVARALMLEGMSATKAIKLLRDKRSEVVLCNKAFETWLMEVQG